MVAHDGKTFWRIVGWVGKNSTAIREVKPIYNNKSRVGLAIEYYTFKASDRMLKIKSLDWYYNNCTLKTFKEIMEMEEANDNIKKTS